METMGLTCSGCGSSDVVLDAKTRILTCNQCGRRQTYARATLIKNGKVVYDAKNAVSFFLDGKYDHARDSAKNVLSISMDHSAALYILSYYDEFVAGKAGYMKMFFNQIKTVVLEYDELVTLRQLFLASAYRMADFEADIIELIAANMQGEEDVNDLTDFIDRICPYLIAKRTSSEFLTDRLAEMYRDLAEHCGIPKTCFALLKSIETNPDSPYVSNSFYMKAKTEYFYKNYVIPIGDVIEKMRSNEVKDKFVKAYQQKKQKFEADMSA